MKIEIVAIGNEILCGNALNTNATFISFQLKKQGYAVSGHSVFSDNANILQKKLLEALKRSDVVIATGGLGPTGDDTTKKAAAKLFKRKIIFDPIFAKRLFKKYGKNKYIEMQADVPENTLILKNEIGTAPGFIFEDKKKALILLPGVPFEMEKMFLPALKYIQKKFPLKEKIYQDELSFCLLKESDIEPVLEDLRKIDADVEIGIYPSLSQIRVCFTTKARNQRKAFLKINKLKKILEKKFKEYIFYPHQIEEAIKDIFISKKKKLALAESCTGGSIAAALTQISGSSKYFLGSIVSYSNELKKNILNVSENTLNIKGAVSLETVEEMVQGLFKITDADYALAISGIAGPLGGSAEKPVGTVCIAIGERGGKIDLGTFQAFGDRELIIKYCVRFALSLLWVRIGADLTYFNDEKKIFTIR